MSRFGWPQLDEDADLGEGTCRLAWDADFCQDQIGRMVRLNGLYLCGGVPDPWGSEHVTAGHEGWVIDVWGDLSGTDVDNNPFQFRMHWRGQAELMYVDAVCVTILAATPDLSDYEAVERWLAVS